MRTAVDTRPRRRATPTASTRAIQAPASSSSPGARQRRRRRLAVRRARPWPRCSSVRGSSPARRCSTSIRSRSAARPTPATPTCAPPPGCGRRQILDVDDGATARGSRRCRGSRRAASSASWPGTSYSRIRERVPVAMFSAPTAAVLVDGEGRVVAPAAMPDADLWPSTGRAAGAPGATVGRVPTAPWPVVAALTPGVRSRVETLRRGARRPDPAEGAPVGHGHVCEPDDIAAKIRRCRRCSPRSTTEAWSRSRCACPTSPPSVGMR